MSGFPLNSVRDAQRFRNAYLGTLSLQQEINTKNFNANALYKRTGVVPTEISDYRSTSEKLADIARLRIAVRGQLREIADSSNAEDIAQEMTTDQVQFVAQNIDALIKELKPKYKLGIVKDIFIPYLVRYMNGEMDTRIAKAGLSTKVNAEPEVAVDLPTDKVPEELVSKMETYSKVLLIEENIRGNVAGHPNENALIQELVSILGSLPPKESLADEVQSLQTLPLDEKRMGANKIIRDLDSVDEVFENISRFYERIGTRGRISTPIGRQSLSRLEAGELPRPNDTPNVELPLLAGKSMYYPDKPLENASNAVLKEYIDNYIDLRPYSTQETREQAGPTLKALTFFIRNKPFTPSLLKNMKQKNIQMYETITTGYSKSTQQVSTPSSQASMGSLFGSPFPTTPVVAESKTGSGMRGRGIGQQEQYAKLGRYHIVLPKLRDDIVAIHNTQYKALPQYKTQRVSVDVGNVLRKIVGGGSPSFDDLSKLNENDKSVLDHIARVTKMAVELPTPSNDKEDANQFEIMKGEIMAGNDSKEMIKRFKVLILKMSHNGRLPKSQCKDLLIELAELGY